MAMALLPRALIPTYSLLVNRIGVIQGTKSTFEVDVLTNPLSNKLVRILLKSRDNQTLTKTDSNKIVCSIRDIFLEFGRQLQLGRLLDDDVFDTLIHQMCENAPITYDIDLQTALWNDIHCSENIFHYTELAKSIESKEAKLKKELASLAYRNPKKMKEFFQEYDSTSVPYGLNGETFTPWEGGSSDMERFRVWECGFEYVNPPEKLIVIGYIEDDAVVMVGSQSGKVYMDEDEIVYNVANNLSDFANHGCPYNPTFFDYYSARPDDVGSLPCAAEDWDKTEDVPEDSKWTFIGHDPAELEADRERARQMYAEMAEYFKPPPGVFLDFSDQQEDPIQSQSFFAQFGDDQEGLRLSPCQSFPSSDLFSQFSSLCIEIKS